MGEGNPRGGLKTVRRVGGGEMVVRVDALPPPPRGWHERASERESDSRSWKSGGRGGEGGGGGGGGDGFFQSSNLLNLFFPRNVAAVSKLLIAIRGEVEEEEEVEGFAGASEGGCAAERFRYMWGRV